MAENGEGGGGGDKTEEPTPRKRQEAREEGNVAKSQDLSASVLMLATLALLWLAGPLLMASMVAFTRLMLSESYFAQVNTAGLWEPLKEATWAVLVVLMPMLAGLALAAVLAHLAQAGFVYAPKKLIPKPDQLHPAKGFKRIFLEPRTYMAFLMNVGKMGVVGVVAWLAIGAELAVIVSLKGLDGVTAAAAGAGVVLAVAFKVGLALLVLGILDFAWQRYRHEQQLKMTKQQVKEEMKRMEGDPYIKQRRRQMAVQRLMQKIRSDVPGADVVVTNPTHFAVALKYDEKAMHAPRVVAKGADLLAMRIRELAATHGVPVVEKPPLARALFQSVEVGQEIPEDFYGLVAELLAYVYALDRASGPVTAGT